MSHKVAGTIVFLTSGAVLVLEILAGRLLAPYFGVTLETFTAIIGVVLAGIAAGTWGGGRFADSRRSPHQMIAPMLIAGGVLGAFAVPVVRAAGPALAPAGIAGLVVLTAAALLPSTAILSAVSPVVVKTVLADLADTGSVVGRLSALGTAGALVGTFATGFILVARFPTAGIIIGAATAMVVMGVAVGLSTHRRFPISALIAVVGILGSSLVSSPCQLETRYFCASVIPDPGAEDGTLLLLDTITHAYVDAADPSHIEFSSIKMLAASIETMTNGPVDALHIGGGGFTLPGWLTATRTGSTNVVLELDRDLVDFVFEEMRPLPVDRVIAGDARTTMGTLDETFDVVIGDAFGGLAVPWHLTTVEFLDQVSDRLYPDGFYAMNLIDHGDLDFIRAEVASVRLVFPHVLLMAGARQMESGGNFIVVGSHREIPADRIATLSDEMGHAVVVLGGSELDDFVGDAAVLTDGHAPVDQLLTTR